MYCVYRCFNNTEIIYPFQNLSVGFILKIFLKLRKFQPRYSHFLYTYKKKMVYLCLQIKIRGDSNAILLLMTWVSGQRVREGWNCRKTFTLPGASSSYPSQIKLVTASFQDAFARIIGKMVCFVQTAELLEKALCFSIIFNPVFFFLGSTGWNFCNRNNSSHEGNFFLQKVPSWMFG